MTTSSLASTIERYSGYSSGAGAEGEDGPGERLALDLRRGERFPRRRHIHGPKIRVTEDATRAPRGRRFDDAIDAAARIVARDAAEDGLGVPDKAFGIDCQPVGEGAELGVQRGEQAPIGKR